MKFLFIFGMLIPLFAVSLLIVLTTFDIGWYFIGSVMGIVLGLMAEYNEEDD